MPFSRIRQRILLKCVPHVQHDYFSSFIQSDLCFLAFSLSLPSLFLTLPAKVDDNDRSYLRKDNINNHCFMSFCMLSVSLVFRRCLRV